VTCSCYLILLVLLVFCLKVTLNVLKLLIKYTLVFYSKLFIYLKSKCLISYSYSVEGFVVGKSVNKVVCPLGLVPWHHMTSIAHQHFRQFSCSLDVSSELFAHVPLVTGSLFVLVSSAPDQGFQCSKSKGISHNDVELAIVNDHSVLFKQLLNPRADRSVG
jgi:hypothetical protein